MRPPMRFRASTQMAVRPERTNSRMANTPAAPAPITMTSARTGSLRGRRKTDFGSCSRARWSWPVAVLCVVQIALGHSLEGHAVNFARSVQRHFVEDDDFFRRFVADLLTGKAD